MTTLKGANHSFYFDTISSSKAADISVLGTTARCDQELFSVSLQKTRPKTLLQMLAWQKKSTSSPKMPSRHRPRPTTRKHPFFDHLQNPFLTSCSVHPRESAFVRSSTHHQQHEHHLLRRFRPSPTPPNSQQEPQAETCTIFLPNAFFTLALRLPSQHPTPHALTYLPYFPSRTQISILLPSLSFIHPPAHLPNPTSLNVCLCCYSQHKRGPLTHQPDT